MIHGMPSKYDFIDEMKHRSGSPESNEGDRRFQPLIFDFTYLASNLRWTVSFLINCLPSRVDGITNSLSTYCSLRETVAWFSPKAPGLTAGYLQIPGIG